MTTEQKLDYLKFLHELQNIRANSTVDVLYVSSIRKRMDTVMNALEDELFCPEGLVPPIISD